MFEVQDPYTLAGRLILVASLYFLMSALSRWRVLRHMIWLPSVVAHEIAHLAVGILMGAKPVSMSIIPRQLPDGDGYELGHVTFERMTWWRALPVATAPLFLLAPAAFLIILESIAEPRSQAEAVFSAYAALQCLAGAWPSPQDWAQARRTIYVLLGLGAIALGLYLGFMVG